MPGRQSAAPPSRAVPSSPPVKGTSTWGNSTGKAYLPAPAAQWNGRGADHVHANPFLGRLSISHFKLAAHVRGKCEVVTLVTSWLSKRNLEFIFCLSDNGYRGTKLGKRPGGSPADA
jgi:hypothetical protein